jgi:hypothetical protein
VHQYAPDWIVDLTDSDATKASNTASNNRAQLLAEMIPARTKAAGASLQQALGDNANFNMPVSFMTERTKWPRTDVYNNVREWRHSDVKDVGYPHLYKLFDKMKQLGGLDQ